MVSVFLMLEALSVKIFFSDTSYFEKYSGLRSVSSSGHRYLYHGFDI